MYGQWLAGIALLVFGLNSVQAADEPTWTPLFNGVDLTGWRIHEKPIKEILEVVKKEKDGKVIGYDGKLTGGKTVALWRVENGTIIGGGPPSHLFTVRDDYENFRYRVEVKINDGGNSGQYFRTAFGPNFPKGYEAQINATHKDAVKSGSLYPGTPDMRKVAEIQVLNTAAHKPDEFFTQEVIAEGDTITILLNGKQTVKWKDPEWRYKKGAFALQGHDPGSIMTFRKVEVIELPPTKK